MLLATSLALPFVLGFGLRNGLQLHVVGPVGAAVGERLDAVDHVALAGSRDRAGVFLLELDLGALAALNSASAPTDRTRVANRRMAFPIPLHLVI